VPVFADMLFQMNDRLHPYTTTGEGSAKEALDALAQDWEATLQSAGLQQ
jgi:multiple sugar transport system substrate-binding protein